MKQLDAAALRELLEKASRSSRRRAHLNLHPALEDPIQRLCIAACAGSYFRPHRHPEPSKWELLALLSGSAAVLQFDDRGTVTERLELAAAPGCAAIELPPLAWHTVVVTGPEAVLLEIKPGPYAPLGERDFAAWSPAEQAPDAARFEGQLRNARVGDNLR
jgi:cupin fold WbuC family metalloprotein